MPWAQKGKKPPQQGSLEEQRMLADMAVAAAHSASASQRFAPPDFAAPLFDPGVGARCRSMACMLLVAAYWLLEYMPALQCSCSSGCDTLYHI